MAAAATKGLRLRGFFVLETCGASKRSRGETAKRGQSTNPEQEEADRSEITTLRRNKITAASPKTIQLRM